MARSPKPPTLREGILAVYALVKGPHTWRSVKLAIDTGATRTMLPPDLLIDIGYHPAKATRHLELSTANGLIIVPLVRVRTVESLGCAVKELEIAAHHLPTESPVEGLLGLDFLAHFQPFQTFYHAIRTHVINT